MSKKFPASYGTRSFIIGFTIRHLSLSCARSIRSTPSHSLPSRSILILYLSSMPRSSKWALSFMFPQQNPICVSLLPIHATYRLTSFMTHQVKRTHAVPKVKVKQESINVFHGLDHHFQTNMRLTTFYRSVCPFVYYIWADRNWASS